MTNENGGVFLLHYFDPEVARRFGVKEAILLRHLQFWIERNRKNGLHLIEGDYWTYNSAKKMSEQLPYFSGKQIQRLLHRLVEAGVLRTGCFNERPGDRTLWYTFTDFGKAVLAEQEPDGPKPSDGTPGNVQRIARKRPMDDPETSNGWPGSGQALPRNIPDHLPDNGTGAVRQPAARFAPPTREEVAGYCRERHNGVDPDRFVDYYTANGWKVGKNPMKDWKAAVRTWEKGDRAATARPRDDTLDGIL